MRRSFLRIPGSPQALQPSKRLRTMRRRSCCNFGSSLSEVVIGNVEPTMFCVSYETRCKYRHFLGNTVKKREKLNEMIPIDVISLRLVMKSLMVYHFCSSICCRRLLLSLDNTKTKNPFCFGLFALFVSLRHSYWPKQTKSV